MGWMDIFDLRITFLVLFWVSWVFGIKSEPSLKKDSETAFKMGNQIVRYISKEKLHLTKGVWIRFKKRRAYFAFHFFLSQSSIWKTWENTSSLIFNSFSDSAKLDCCTNSYNDWWINWSSQFLLHFCFLFDAHCWSSYWGGCFYQFRPSESINVPKTIN